MPQALDGDCGGTGRLVGPISVTIKVVALPDYGQSSEVWSSVKKRPACGKLSAIDAGDTLGADHG